MFQVRVKNVTQKMNKSNILRIRSKKSAPCNEPYRGHPTNFYIGQLRAKFAKRRDCQSNSHILIGGQFVIKHVKARRTVRMWYQVHFYRVNYLPFFSAMLCGL